MQKSFIIRVTFVACMMLVVLTSLQHHKSFTADEVYELRNYSTDCFVLAERPDGFPPLYGWLLGHFAQIAGPSNSRLLSSLFAIIGMIFVAAAGKQFEPNIGLRSALFYAVSACQLEYAQQVRAYSLYICLGAAVIWSALCVVNYQRKRDWFCLVFSSVAIMWTHYFAVPFLVGIWLGVAILSWNNSGDSKTRRRVAQQFLVSSLASTGLLLPWFYTLRIDLQNPPPIEAINPVDFTGVAYTYLTIVQGWCFGPAQIELFEWSKGHAIRSVAPWAICSGLVFATLLYHACFKVDPHSEPQSGARKAKSFAWMAALLICVPICSALLAVITDSSFVGRYVAVLVVPFSLLMGAGSCFTRYSWRSVASYCLVAINLISFANRNFSETHDRENYRELVAKIRSNSDSPRLLVLSHYLGHAIEYQFGSVTRLTMVGLNSDEPDDWKQVLLTHPELLGRQETLWIAADWMRADDLRLARRNKILAELGAKHVARISGTIELFRVDSELFHN